MKKTERQSGLIITTSSRGNRFFFTGGENQEELLVTMSKIDGVTKVWHRGKRGCNQNHRVAGDFEIESAGIYDYRNRVYSQELGRFLQTDPIRFNAGDVNIYRYCGNNGVNCTDPEGLCRKSQGRPGGFHGKPRNTPTPRGNPNRNPNTRPAKTSDLLKGAGTIMGGVGHFTPAPVGPVLKSVGIAAGMAGVAAGAAGY